MSNADRQLEAQIAAELLTYEGMRKLPGIRAAASRATFLAQVVESVRRADYYPFLRSKRRIAPSRRNPQSPIFDPILAAILYQEAGEIDEASWLVFVSVYFGRHRRTGWRLASDVYGALGAQPWTWARLGTHPSTFRPWVAQHEATLRDSSRDRHFGNHRKYETLKASSPRGIAAAFESYAAWVNAAGGHRLLFRNATSASDTPEGAFDLLYRSMDVASFGRTAKFDYLVMIQKLGLAPIAAGSLYLSGSTGPAAGARLLFGSSSTPTQLDELAVELARAIGVPVHVLEDALCNWQKSPNILIRFRG